MSELESFFEEEPVAEVEPQEVTESTETTEETTAETKTEDETNLEQGSTAEPKEDGKIPIAALLDERVKRQERDRRIQELEAQIAAKEPKEELKIPDPLDDAEGFAGTLKGQLEKIPETVNEAVQQRLDQASYRRAERKYGEDFQAKLLEANDFLNQNPQVQLVGDDIVEEAFEAYDKHLEMQKLNDPNYLDKVKAELKDELRKELLAEQSEDAEKKAAQEKLEAALTPSLAGQRGAGTVGAVTEVDDPLETTFNR